MAQLRPQSGLTLWHMVLASLVREEGPDLTARQLSVLLSVYVAAPPHTVKALSQALNLKKPAVTRALDVLEREKLIKRKIDETDKRVVLIQRTMDGAKFLNDLGERISRAHSVVMPK